MDLDLEIVLDKKSTKRIILNLLMEKQPQTLKEINLKLQKQKKISYQATHKAIKEMQEDCLLEKDKNFYNINQTWLDELSKTINQLKQKQEKENTPKIYNFSNYSTFAKFIIETLSTTPTQNKPSLCVMKHSWPPLGLDQTDLSKITLFLKKGKYYDLTINTTSLDIAFAKTLEKMGKIVKIGSKIKLENDFLIQGNKIINVKFEEKLKNTIHKIFKKHKQLDEKAIQEIITKIVTEKYSIQAIIQEDEEHAEKIRKDILKEFNLIK